MLFKVNSSGHKTYKKKDSIHGMMFHFTLPKSEYLATLTTQNYLLAFFPARLVFLPQFKETLQLKGMEDQRNACRWGNALGWMTSDEYSTYALKLHLLNLKQYSLKGIVDNLYNMKIWDQRIIVIVDIILYNIIHS